MDGEDGAVEAGLLDGGLPYRAVGTGRTLVYFPPFAPYHTPTTGLGRAIEVGLLRRFAAGGFRVVAIGRRPGLAPGTTMDDLAAQYARALAARFAGPVDILGFSTGGALVLTLAADFPERVQRLVLARAAHRLSSVAIAACARAARRAEWGGRRGFQAALAPAAANAKPARWAAAAFGWLLAPVALGRDRDPSDAVITLRADIGITVAARLGRVAAPTLIVCGECDPSSPPAITAELAEWLPDARRIVYPRAGHGVVTARRFPRDLAAFLIGER